MVRFLFVIFIIIFVPLVTVQVISWHQESKQAEHDALTKGCVMTGTTQGYFSGLESIPSQEQWECNGLMRTVNAI